MSIAAKVGLLYLGLLLGILFIMFGTTVLNGAGIEPYMGVFVAGFVLVFGVIALLIRCPNCGKSVFIRSGGIVLPWPETSCSRCGAKLTGRGNGRDIRSR